MSNPIVNFKIGWNACIQCSACIAVCPQGPEFISEFNTIAVHTPCDIACMNCVDICPVSTITSYKPSPDSTQTEAIKMHSLSGDLK